MCVLERRGEERRGDLLVYKLVMKASLECLTALSHKRP